MGRLLGPDRGPRVSDLSFRLLRVFELEVCDICCLREYCCFNDVRFDNIEYFAETQLIPTVRSTSHTLACVVMKGLNRAHAHSFTA